jgi:DNA-binding response OmpR family regulator
MKATHHVWVVEDHEGLRQSTLKVLEQAGFVVRGFECAEDVDDAVPPQKPDAYVIDLNLPDEDGLSLARRLRRAQPEVAIVITTARTHINDRIEGYDAGADIYMPKPVAPEELLAGLRRLLMRKEATTLQQGLELKTDTLLLIGPAGQCKLAATEVRLLAALAVAKNQTLERWQLMLHLNPQGQDVSGNYLQVRLSHLRRKIAACGMDGESIKALRGTGYQLCVPLVLN